MKSLRFPDSSLFGLDNESVSDLTTSDQICHDNFFYLRKIRTWVQYFLFRLEWYIRVGMVTVLP